MHVHLHPHQIRSDQIRYLDIRIHMHIYIYIYIYIHIFMHIYICTYVHIYNIYKVYMRTYTYTQTGKFQGCLNMNHTETNADISPVTFQHLPLGISIPTSQYEFLMKPTEIAGYPCRLTLPITNVDIALWLKYIINVFFTLGLARLPFWRDRGIQTLWVRTLVESNQ